MARRRSSRKKSSSGAGFGLFLLLVLLAAGGAAAWFVFLPAGPAKETYVEIAPGSSTAKIAQQLQHAGVIRSRYGFEAVRLWKRGVLKAGEYRFDHPAPVTEVYSRVARGDVFTIAVTVPEGASRFEIATRIRQAGLLQSGLLANGPPVAEAVWQDFVSATVKETPLIADLDPQAKNVEGYLFPDTYRFPRRATAAQIVTAMVHRFRVEAGQIGLMGFAQTSPRVAPVSRPATANPTGTETATNSVHDVVTLASLVERETAVDAERPLVASVLTNRLKAKMPLMTDPAVIYGLEQAGKWRGAIYQSDLNDVKNDTPYNTYRHAGLPPGPVANPGLPSLKAAMHPAATNYLYFVAAGVDPQGKSRFAATLDEHNRNVASYRQAIRQAGGR